VIVFIGVLRCGRSTPSSFCILFSLFVWRLAWVAHRVGDVGGGGSGAGVRKEGRTSAVVSPTRGP